MLRDDLERWEAGEEEAQEGVEIDRERERIDRYDRLMLLYSRN